MKKITILIVLIALLTMSLMGCTNESGEEKNEPLVIGTMANALGLPVQRAIEAGYFEESGLEIEMLLFASGAPINEAMAADELDVAVSGLASVYALSTGRYTYIGDGCITVGGQTMFARPGTVVAETAGVIDGTFGEKDALVGKSVLGPLATTAHYQAIKYMESFGLTTEDFDMVSMDYAQAYQAFITGEGDLIATIPPYNTQLEAEGYVQVCDVSLVMGSPIIDTVYAQNEVVEERRDDVKKFLDAYYRACTDLKNDDELRAEVALRWYSAEGRTYSEADMASEIAQQTYHTFDTLLSDEYQFGLTMSSIGEFFTGQEMIEQESLPNVEASFDTTLLEEIKAEK